MAKILLNDIIDSLSFDDGLFQTLRDIEPIYDSCKRMIFSAGRKSAVFKVRLRGEPYALKCYTIPQPTIAERHDYVNHLNSSVAIVKPTLRCKELWVNDSLIDVSVYRWLEGRTFDWNIRRCLHNDDMEHLSLLLDNFLRLSLSLLSEEWRHGDLKTENIIIQPDGQMVLVDCDAIFAPSIAPSHEVGTPHWVHPSRQSHYDQHIDDYAIAIIVVSLAALIAKPSLYTSVAMVAMPHLGNREEILRLLAHSEPLSALHEAIYSDNYKISNLKEILECIAHTLHENKKPLL